MKKHVIIIALMTIVNVSQVYSVNPTYILEVNDKTTSANYVEFDIDLTWTNPGSVPSFIYAGGEFHFDFNKAIKGTSTTVTMAYVDSSIPSHLRPRNPVVYTSTTPGQLRWAVNTFPGSGNGYSVPGGAQVRLLRVIVQSNFGNFSFQPLNLTWRNGPSEPYSKIYAFVGSSITDISTPSTHRMSIDNFPIGHGILANFYSSQRTVYQGQPVSFYDSSLFTSAPTSWSWSFPGSNQPISNVQYPTGIKYATPGVYDVSLSVWSSCCSDIETKTGYITVLAGCFPNWIHRVKIRDAGNANDSLTYGMSYTGTNGVEQCLGELLVPPPPPTGVFDCRFILPTNDASKTDIRQDGDFDLSWRMTFQPSSSGYPITFSWNPALLPSFGTFFLKDEITGSIVNINMRNQSSYVLTLSGLTSLKIEYYYSRTFSTSVNSGWNIISVPVRAPDMNYTSIFYGTSSQPFAYNNGYVTTTTLSNGVGYWLRFNSANNFNITGYIYQPENMNVTSGWNLIGPFDKNIPVSSVVSNPSGIVNSFFFGYTDRYVVAETLKVGKGYWVRTTASGYLYKGSTDNIENVPAANAFANLSELRFSSVENGNASLYLGMADELTGDYTMPPVPPQGIFDVRFGTDRFAEVIGQSQIVKLNSATGETKLTVYNTKGVKFRVKDAIDGSILNEELTEGREILVPANLNTLVIESSGILPLTYELSQNYPNPFNPVTTIKYQIPKDGMVKLVLFDVLGREVKMLVNNFQPAGAYSVRLDASDLSSGVYFYKLSVSSSVSNTDALNRNFEDLKKMVVIK